MPPSKRDIREQLDEDAIEREHHLAPEVSPALGGRPGRRSRAAKTPLVAEQSTVCPRCGGELRFTTAPNFYGQTIEQCVNVVRCGHWRTLEAIRRPERTPAPRGIDPAPRRRKAGVVGHGAVTAAMLAALPTREAEAISPQELARRTGHPEKPVAVWCSNSRRAGHPLLRWVDWTEPGKTRRRVRYWRVA